MASVEVTATWWATRILDHRLHRRRGEVDRGDAEDPLRRAQLGLLAGDELAVGEEAVLEAVDAGGGGFAEADRAQVAGDLEPAAMRGGDGGVELRAGDVVVDLERRDALLRPVVDEARDGGGIGGARELREGRDSCLRCRGR